MPADGERRQDPYDLTLPLHGRVCVTLGLLAGLAGFALTGYLLYLGLNALVLRREYVPWEPWLPIGLVLFFGGLGLNGVGSRTGRRPVKPGR